MKRPKATQFHDASQFLQAYIQYRKDTENGFSLRKFAFELGFNTPGYLSNVLKKNRHFTIELLEKIERIIDLTDDEKRWLILNTIEVTRETDSSSYLQKLLKPLGLIDINYLKLSLDKYELINNWYHYAILEMTLLKDFSIDPEWISKKLKQQISILEAEGAVKRLLRLGLLKEESNRYFKTNKSLFVGEEIPNKIIQNYHLQMLEKSKSALKNQTVDQREFTATTMTIRCEDKKRIKELIRKFNLELHGLTVESDGDETICVNIQMFGSV